MMLEAIFEQILALSIAGGVTTLAVLLVKRGMRGRLSARWDCYIWALALVMYLVPFAIPLPRLLPREVAAVVPPQVLSATVGASVPAAQVLATAQEGFRLTQLPLAWLWLLGVVLSLGVRWVDYRRLRTALGKCSRPCGQKTQELFAAALEKNGVPQGRLTPMVCTGVDSPLLMGFFHPVVALPHEDYTPAQLSMVFSHELTHYRFHDLWYKGLALGVAVLHWFNPLVYLLLRDVDRCCELCCDRRLMGRMDEEERRDYGSLLLDVAAGGSHPHRASTAFLAMNKEDLKQRLALLLAKENHSRLEKAAALALALAIAVTGAVCSSAMNPHPLVLPSSTAPKADWADGDTSIPEIWGGSLSQPQSIPQPAPTDLNPPDQDQPPVVTFKAVLSDQTSTVTPQQEEEETRRMEAALVPQTSKAPALAPQTEASVPPEEAASEEEPAPQEESQPDPDLSWDGEFLWPVCGGYISAGLYSYYSHTGVDIAADAGTEIYAAADGVVTYSTAVSIWPYGKSILISHGDGVVTRYAHCSEVLVSEGDVVSRGELIARVGRTGNASGNHCHFEVRIDGVLKNPVNYIGNKCP